MAKKSPMRESNIPLSQFSVRVVQLESIVNSTAHKSPDPLLCFDLLSYLISSINDENKESIMLWQRKCEDALHSLLVLGARRPVRHLASLAMAKTIWKGDPISIYSRANSLQGFISDGKRSEPQSIAGVAQCLGELYCHFGRKITSGFSETTSIVSKLMMSHEWAFRKGVQIRKSDAAVTFLLLLLCFYCSSVGGAAAHLLSLLLLLLLLLCCCWSIATIA